MNKLILAALVLPLTTSAFAQGAVSPIEAQQPLATGTVIQPGGIDNGGPGSIGVVAPGATGAETRSNNSGAGGNAEQNQRPIGNTGGGGGGGNGGGG